MWFFCQDFPFCMFKTPFWPRDLPWVGENCVAPFLSLSITTWPFMGPSEVDVTYDTSHNQTSVLVTSLTTPATLTSWVPARVTSLTTPATLTPWVLARVTSQTTTNVTPSFRHSRHQTCRLFVFWRGWRRCVGWAKQHPFLKSNAKFRNLLQYHVPYNNKTTFWRFNLHRHNYCCKY